MERPKVTDYFDNNEKGNIQSLDVDFPSYQSALNEYIDQLEAENKELRDNLKKELIEFERWIINHKENEGLFIHSVDEYLSQKEDESNR